MQNPSIRGLLLYFTVGFGKTILAISLARIYKQKDPRRKIVVLLSKGLIQNFKDNVKKFLKQYPEYNIPDMDLAKEIDSTFKFISFRSNMMFKKMSRVQKTDEQLEFEEQIGDINKVLMREEGFLENTVLIIDEVHNFFNAITNGSKNSLQLYDSIMKTKDIKLFFLTGTPIVNDPFELVPCFNMLKGPIEIPTGKPGKKATTTLFPESRKEFYNYFVDVANLDVKNKSRFQNRIMGLSSYYGDLYFDDRNPDFPEQLPTILVRVPMSPEQFSAYDVARDLEIDEASYKKRHDAQSERFSTSGSKGTYRVRTRQISNFVFPEYALGAKKGKKMQEKYIERITDADWDKLEVFSPKIAKLVDMIKKHENQLGFVYSEFVKGEGLAIVAKVLSRLGYVNWEDADEANAYEIEGKASKYGGKKVFAIVTGELDIAERSRIIDEFNSDDNMHGEKIALLLVNKIAAEGLDLKGVRHIHILEPFWNYSRIEQVIGRGVRYKSHERYPENERNVQPYFYLSDYPESYPKEKIKEPTTDLDMYEKAMKQNTTNQNFNLSIVESSIDCLSHYAALSDSVKKRIHCKLCSPTNKPLYHPLIAKDFSVPDPCTPLAEYKVQATELLAEGTDEKFAYVVDSKEDPPKIYIYEFNSDINGYTILRANHPLRGVLMNKVLDTL
jgi:superfamily II DNA or RNA helicase